MVLHESNATMKLIEWCKNIFPTSIWQKSHYEYAKCIFLTATIAYFKLPRTKLPVLFLI